MPRKSKSRVGRKRGAVKRVDVGELPGGFPYARAGDGPRVLLVIPGLQDALFRGRYPVGAGWALRWYFARFVDDHAVHVVSRPRGLPDGRTVADMADGYATVLADELGPADVVGISMGGMIAQELGVRHPDLVDRLVLANTGVRIDDRTAVERFLQYARDRDWARMRAELAAATFTDWRGVWYPTVALTAGRLLPPRPAVPDDVRVSLEAVGAFDASDRVADVEAPTLVFGGTDDPFFPESVLAETAASIPNAELAVVPGGKHGAFHERKATFDARVDAFLERTAESAREAS